MERGDKGMWGRWNEGGNPSRGDEDMRERGRGTARGERRGGEDWLKWRDERDRKKERWGVSLEQKLGSRAA